MLAFIIELLLNVLLFVTKPKIKPVTVAVITLIVFAVAAITIAKNTSVN